MPERVVVDVYNFDSQDVDKKTVDGYKVQQFISWLLSNNGWLDYPDLLTEKAMRLRKELKEDVRDAGKLEIRGAVTRSGPGGKFMSTKK